MHPDGWAVRLEGGDPAAQMQADAVVVHLLVYEVGHFGVKRCHYLRSLLHQMDLQSGHGEVFSHLQSDESATDHNRILHVVLPHVLFYAVSIGDIAQREYAFAPDARQIGHYRVRSGGEQQFVVVFLIGFAGFRLPDADCLTFRDDLNGLRKRANVYLEAL